jgi:hypothetical protein
MAVLYKSQGRPDLSLAVYLRLQLPSVFDFIQVSCADVLQLWTVHADQPPHWGGAGLPPANALSFYIASLDQIKSCPHVRQAGDASGAACHRC